MIRAEDLLDMVFSERSKKGAREILKSNFLQKMGIESQSSAIYRFLLEINLV